jgi:hypothetical protein
MQVDSTYYIIYRDFFNQWAIKQGARGLVYYKDFGDTKQEVPVNSGTCSETIRILNTYFIGSPKPREGF